MAKTDASVGKPVVVATRPPHQNEAWAKLIAEQGYEVALAPMMSINPVDDSPQVKASIVRLDEFNKIIFVSQNAVAHGFDWIDTYWPEFPLDVHCYGVGLKTTQAIQSRLDALTASIESAQGSMTSEDLLALPSLQDVVHQKVLIMRGVGGRTKLQETLAERGAHVQLCELYHRRPLTLPEHFVADYADREWIIPVFSGETLQILTDQLMSVGVKLNKISVIVPSERVRQMAEVAGYKRKRVAVASNATEMAMLNALQTLSH